MRTQLVVGVCGGSGAGKHRVIHHHLLPALKDAAILLEHDWYFHPLDRITQAQGVSSRLEVNYDIPEAYENDLLIHHIEELQAGRPIEVHPYLKPTGWRRTEPYRFEPKEVVIVDGMMVLSVPELVSRMHIRAYVHADDSLRLSRRVTRDLDFCSAEENEMRFFRDVLPAHRRFVEPSRQHAHFILDNSHNGEAPAGIDDFIDAVLGALEDLRQGRLEAVIDPFPRSSSRDFSRPLIDQWEPQPAP